VRSKFDIYLCIVYNIDCSSAST